MASLASVTVTKPVKKRTKARIAFHDSRMRWQHRLISSSNFDECEQGDVLVLRNYTRNVDLGVYRWDGMRAPDFEDWPTVLQQFSRALADSGVIKSAYEYRVLFHMLDVAAFGNSVFVNQSDLAKTWGCEPSTLSQAFRSLVKKKALILTGKDRAGNSYRLNPNFGA